MIAELEQEPALDRVTQEATPQGIVRYTYDVIGQRLSLQGQSRTMAGLISWREQR